MKGALNFIINLDEAIKVKSRNQKVELTKDQEFELSKQSKLPAKMRVGMYTIHSSIHAQARAAQRRNDKTAEEWKVFARKVVKYVEENKITKGAYMFHSESENQSVVGRVKGKVIEFITVFPKGTGGRQSKKQQDLGQKQAIMESLMIDSEIQVLIQEAVGLIGSELDGIIVMDV